MNHNLELSDEELDFVVKALDLSIRNNGMQVIGIASNVLAKIQNSMAVNNQKVQEALANLDKPKEAQDEVKD